MLHFHGECRYNCHLQSIIKGFTHYMHVQVWDKKMYVKPGTFKGVDLIHVRSIMNGHVELSSFDADTKFRVAVLLHLCRVVKSIYCVGANDTLLVSSSLRDFSERMMACVDQPSIQALHQLEFARHPIEKIVFFYRKCPSDHDLEKMQWSSHLPCRQVIEQRPFIKEIPWSVSAGCNCQIRLRRAGPTLVQSEHDHFIPEISYRYPTTWLPYPWIPFFPTPLIGESFHFTIADVPEEPYQTIVVSYKDNILFGSRIAKRYESGPLILICYCLQHVFKNLLSDTWFMITTSDVNFLRRVFTKGLPTRRNANDQVRNAILSTLGFSNVFIYSKNVKCDLNDKFHDRLSGGIVKYPFTLELKDQYTSRDDCLYMCDSRSSCE
jgi:hypothetical protein